MRSIGRASERKSFVVRADRAGKVARSLIPFRRSSTDYAFIPPAPCAPLRIHSPSRLSLSWIIERASERARERARKREVVFSRVAIRRALHSVRKKHRQREAGGCSRGGRKEEKEEEEEEKEEKEDEVEVVGLRASPARVGAYIDHERVYDIREYIIRGL